MESAFEKWVAAFIGTIIVGLLCILAGSIGFNAGARTAKESCELSHYRQARCEPRNYFIGCTTQMDGYQYVWTGERWVR